MGKRDPNSAVDVVNIGTQKMKFEIDGSSYELAPKETIKIHPSYAYPRKMQEGRDTVPAIIENLTGGNVLPTTHPKARKALGLKPLTQEEIAQL